MVKKLYQYSDMNIDREFTAVYMQLQRPGKGLPVYADNAAALAGGLKVDQEYRTSTGVRMVVY